MFDYFQIIDFKSKLNLKDFKFSFLSREEYSDIKGIEYSKNYNLSSVVYLERAKTGMNVTYENDLSFFLYGTVYSNNNYLNLTGVKPHILTALEISEFNKRYGDKFIDYIKGSFVILIYDSGKNILKVITDRLNVLPLYYCFSDGLLIISSSVRMIVSTGLVNKEIDDFALTEQLLFDYLLNDRTFFKYIKQTSSGTVYEFDKDNKKIREYWNVENLYNDKLIGKKESLELLSTCLSENVDLYTSDSEKLLVSLTGGFDGRANLALLKKDINNFLCYSYGMPGSKQVEVPKLISKKLGINYEPVYLDEHYELEHDECTRNAIEFSNGTAPIIRSNYPYAYKKLRNYSNVILTGLFGSEVMRPLHNLGIMMNDYSERLFLSKEPSLSLKESLNVLLKKNYLSDIIVQNSIDFLIEEINNNYIKRYENYDMITRFFFFILKEGVRKYFMQEIQIERVYVTTRFPFFDDDFVELMYKTPYAGMYNGFLGKSKIKRRRGQLLYAYIYKRFKPELGKIILDRGYKPDDLLKPFPFNYLSLLNGVRKNNAYKRKGNDTFDSVRWTKEFIKNILENTTDNTKKFGNGLNEIYKSGNYTNDLLKYSHFISIFKYLNSF